MEWWAYVLIVLAAIVCGYTPLGLFLYFEYKANKGDKDENQH